MTELVAGRVIDGRIKLERRLGEGGMGSVWIAEHLALGTRVAVKFIDADLLEKNPELRQRFSREAAIAAKITSPHVVRTFDFGTLDDGTPYLVMELLNGESLWDRLQRERPLAAAVAVDVVKQAAKALDDAHLHGVVHRDIKPGNIFLTQSGRDVFVKVLDFGIAKSVEAHTGDSATKTGMTLGTPAYMSPEQLMSTKGVDLQADLWALAVTAYEALLGVQPFRGETVPSLIVSIHSSSFDAPSSTSGTKLAHLARLDAFFKRAFASKAADRYATALDLADALAAAVDGRDWSPREDAASAAPPRTAYGSPIDEAAGARKGATEIKAPAKDGTDPGAPIDAPEPKKEAKTDPSPATDPASARTEYATPADAPAPKPKAARPADDEPRTKVSPSSAPPPRPPADAPAAKARPAWIVPALVGAGVAAAVAVWFATRPPEKPKEDAPSAATQSASAPTAVASARPSASAAPKGPPPELDVPAGKFKFGKSDTELYVTASHVRVLGTTQASLADAFAACIDAGAGVPCGEHHWERACELEPTLGATATWTGVVDGTRAISRGGANGCDSREPVNTKGEPRAVVCCEPGATVRASEDKAIADAVGKYLAVIDAEDAAALGGIYAETIVFNGTEHPRGKLIGMGKSWFEAHPDQRYVFGLCSVASEGPNVTTTCPATIHRDKKLLTVTERLVWKDGRVGTVEDTGVTNLP